MLPENKINLKNILSKKQYLIVFLFFLIILALLCYTFFYPNSIGRKSFRFEIRKGTTLNQVIDTLYDAGIIPSKRNMRVVSFFLGADKNIKAGRYEVPDGINYIQLVLMFKEGKCEVPVHIFVYNGITDKGLARILHQKISIDSLTFLDLCNDIEFAYSKGINASSMQGYLLPGDYYFYKDTPVKEIIDKFKSEFDKFIVDSLNQRLAVMKYSLHQVLTMASIIQGESKKVDEYTTISGVYYNRLRKGMKLQACPTVQYLLKTGWRRLLNRDLLINSPYNTYLYSGLPPGPINNPGKAAILAALYPEEHNYLFFVADGTGGHKFSTNYADHMKAFRKYRNWRDEVIIK
jgi:UPF0755 protein